MCQSVIILGPLIFSIYINDHPTAITDVMSIFMLVIQDCNFVIVTSGNSLTIFIHSFSAG